MKSNIFILIIVLMSISLLSSQANAQQDITFNETFSFNGGAQTTDSLTATGTANLIANTYTIGAINDFFSNFTNGKIIVNVTMPFAVSCALGGVSCATFQLNTAATGINSQFVPFTATVAGTSYGTGSIGWTRTTGNTFLYRIRFDTVNTTYANTLTGTKEITFSYDKTVYSNYLNNPTIGNDGSFQNVTSFLGTYALTGVNSQELGGGCGGSCTMAAALVAGSSEITIYTISDSATLTFNNATVNNGWVNLTKNSANMREQIVNSTGYIFYDNTSVFNVNQYILKDNGIVSNTFDVSTGLWANRTLVANGGAVVTPTPTPIPAPTAPPQNSNGFGISFDQGSYNTGDSGNILTNNTFVSFDLNSYTVDFFSTKNPLIAQFQIDKSQSIQNFTVPFSTADTYTANLVQHPLLGSDIIVATASVQALQPSGFINSDNLVQVGKLFNVTYKYGVTPTFSHINGIKTFFIDAGVPVQENFFTVGNTAAGNQFTTQIYVNKKGSYILYLFDAGRGNVASKAIQSDFFQDTNTTSNITTSNITLLNPQPSNAYGFNDLMQVNFQVDNSNWTNGSQQIMIDVFNTDTNTETISFPVIDQVGAFSFFLQNGYYPNGFFSSGNNQVRLIAQNGGTRVLDFKTFTLSGINDAGYGLTLDKFTACIDENIKITYTTPTAANFSIQQIQSSGNVQLEFGSVNGTRTLTRTFSRTGSYLIQLIRQSDNTIQQEAKVTINDCGATPVPTTTPSPIEAATGLIGILGNIAFYGFVLWLGIIGSIAAYMSRSPSGVNGGSLVFIGALASTFISIIGLFGDFKIYVLVITWVLAGVYWRFARDSTTG